uniref:Uncharacterized protein n=1 Tax=Guillardia theta TaxID=55529 RepID=A0A7S4P4Q0_GUITH|mmetsp:Transcript_43048/g.136045  ORF Transcript_43048/g.136045 Transcript_43048/m.136045 type:complete len:348 (+) Transcript_43048:83-1126(+)
MGVCDHDRAIHRELREREDRHCVCVLLYPRQVHLADCDIFLKTPLSILNSNTELSRSPYWHDPGMPVKLTAHLRLSHSLFLPSGFRRALELLEQEHAMIVHRFNIADEQVRPTLEQEISRKRFSFIFAKGCWHTPVDKYMRSRILRLKPKSMKAGLFPACSSAPPPDEETGEPISLVYDVIYYDKLWLRGTFSHHPLAIHAFGVDAGKTFRASGNQRSGGPKLFDYVSVGIFAPWKRHENILDKNGSRLVVGYGWRPQESSEVISALFSGGVAVWQNLHPSKMCLLYMNTEKLLMAANELGGGERVILEARACGLPAQDIEVAADNHKILEFLDGPIYNASYYSSQV